TSAFGCQAAKDVLPEGIVGPSLRWRAIEVAPPGVGGESFAIPLLDGIGGIGQDHVEGLEAVALNDIWLGKGVAAHNAEILDAVEKAVHPGDGGGHEIALLPIEQDITPFLTLASQMGDAREKHSTGAAGGVVNGFARLWPQHLGHEMNDGTVGV